MAGRGLHAEKYTSDGDIEWTVEYGEGFRGSTVKVDPSNNVYHIFEKEGTDFSTTAIVAKNSQLPAIISSSDEEELSPNRFQLYQNYPNPFNPTTAISFSLSAVSFVELKLFDVLGREVRTLVNESLSVGMHNIVLDARGLASGMYFYRLKAAGFSEVKKMIVLR